MLLGQFNLKRYYQFASKYLAAYLCYGILGALYIPAGHDDRGSPLGQLLRRLLADAGVGAGHEEHPVLQIAGAPASSPGTLSTFAQQADEQDHREYEVTPRGYHIVGGFNLARTRLSRNAMTRP